jgi:hypothetical protein
LGLFDVSSGKDRPVEFALKTELRDPEGYYRLATVSVTAAPSGSLPHQRSIPKLAVAP